MAYSAVRTGLRVMYVEADELLTTLVVTPTLGKQQRLKPALDADLLVLDDLFMARRIAQENADELQALIHKRYKLRRLGCLPW